MVDNITALAGFFREFPELKFNTLITALLFALKVTSTIQISWMWVFAPLTIPYAVVLFMVIIMVSGNTIQNVVFSLLCRTLLKEAGIVAKNDIIAFKNEVLEFKQDIIAEAQREDADMESTSNGS